MKKKGGAGRIIAVVALLLAVCVFAVFASGMKIGFIENYSYNFKKNMLALTRHFGITLSEPMREYLEGFADDAPNDASEQGGEGEPAASEPDQSSAPEIETAEDIPDVEFKEPQIGNKKTKSIPVALEDAATAKYGKYRGYLLCVNETSVMAFDTSGKNLWAVGIHMSDPILKISGNYYVIAERGGKKIMAFDGKKLLYESQADGSIKNVSISSGGDVAVVSAKENYKGTVIVINKSGDKIFAWNSGSDVIMDADISSASRRLAVSLLNTENGAVSRVHFFNISKTQSYAESELAGSIAFDTEYLGEVLNVFADDKICGISQRGKTLWEVDFSDRKLLHYRTDSSGYKLILADRNNVPELEVLSARGKQKSLISTETAPEHMDISSGLIAYNVGRELKFSTVTAKREQSYTCPRDIRDIYIIDSDSVVIVYNSGLDFIKFV